MRATDRAEIVADVIPQVYPNIRAYANGADSILLTRTFYGDGQHEFHVSYLDLPMIPLELIPDALDRRLADFNARGLAPSKAQRIKLDELLGPGEIRKTVGG